MNDREMRSLQVLEAFVRAYCPYDTGNLLSSVRIVQRDSNFGILIGGEIADYVVYTNEAWVAERWHGRQNPNQGWIESAIQAALPEVKRVMSGAMTQSEYDNIIASQNKVVQETRERRIASIEGTL